MFNTVSLNSKETLKKLLNPCPLILFFPSVLWHCWLGDQEGHPACKKLDVGLLVVMIWLELCTTYLQLSPPPPPSFASINSGWPGFTWRLPLKRRDRVEFSYVIAVNIGLWLLKDVKDYAGNIFDGPITGRTSVFWPAHSTFCHPPPCWKHLLFCGKIHDLWKLWLWNILIVKYLP